MLDSLTSSTHFVAPAFVFLAGTGAWLYGQRAGRAALAKFLLTRGAWLIVLELSVLRVAWTFNFDYAHYWLAGVIWMIGWCMIGLAALAYLPPRAVLAFGLAVVLGHNLMDFVPWPESPGALASILYYGGAVPGWPRNRRLLSQWGNRYIGLMLKLPVRDATAGFRAYDAEIIRKIGLDRIRADGYGFQIEMAYEVTKAGGTIVEVPITFRDRVRGTSKMAPNIVGEALWLVTRWGVRDRVARRRRRRAPA